MPSRRGATDLCGVLAVDKPAGMTSHDVVSAVRRATGERRIGHAGTLDPMATGLLVVLVGAYTRLEPYLSAATKAYEARIAFGTETDTDDAEGTPTVSLPVPGDLFDAARAQEVLDTLLGESLQTPPAYSAIKVGGRTAHRVARAGGQMTMEPRRIEVYKARLQKADSEARTWDVTFLVSKGTYIRALARDLGRTSGTAAHLAALRRTQSGPLDLAQAHTLDEVREAAERGDLPALFADALRATALPAVAGDPAEVATGRRLPRAATLPPGAAAAIVADGRVLAVYRSTEAELVPEAVFPQSCL